MARLIISGWYGFGNLGDEAILYSIAKSLKQHFPNAEITALSFDPTYTRKYQQINSVQQLPSGCRSWLKAILNGELFQTIRAFVTCDILILGGGGFLSDWQPEAPWVWLRQALFAKVMGVKVMLYGIGAGPFNRKWGSWVTRTLITYCVDAVNVRDDKSKQWLVSTGLCADKIMVTADPAVNYPLKQVKALKVTSPNVIGICIAPIFHSEQFWPGKRYKYQRYVDSMNRVVAGLIENGFMVRFISMQESTDYPFAQEILKGIPSQVEILKSAEALDDAVAQLAEVDILITMRFHAAILGALQGIPVAAIIYHHKVSEFIDRIGMREFAQELGDDSNWRESDIDSDRLVRNIKAISDNYEAVKTRMLKTMQQLQNAELENPRTIGKLLEKCR